MSDISRESFSFPEGFRFPTLEEFERRRVARVDTLTLASATATLLYAAGVEVDKIENEYTKPITKTRRRLLLGPYYDVQVGEEEVVDTVARGWELSRNISQNGDHMYHTNYDLLVLEQSGQLAALEFTHSIHFGSGYSRRQERYGGDVIGVDSPYPELGIKGRFVGYERRHREEDLVQHKLAALVVPYGHHVDTMFEEQFETLALAAKRGSLDQLSLPL